MLVETIRKAQKGDEKSVLEMIAQFECLLTRYAHLLKYEDALNDLTLDFIVLLKQVNTSIFAGKSDGVVVNYIAQTIKHSYIRRSKQRAKVNSMETLFEDLSEGQRYHVENTNTCTNDELLGITELLSGKNLTVWGDRIFEKCGIGRDERGDGGKTLEIRGKRRLSARDGGANYQQS